MGFFNSKKKSGIRASTQSVEPLRPTQHTQYQTHQLFEYEKKDLAYKIRIRVLRFITRFLSLILNVTMIYTMSFSLGKYYTTKNKKAGDVPAWNKNTVLWPSMLVLGVASLTFILNFATLIQYCRRAVKAANKFDSITSSLGYLALGVHFLAWVGVSGTYRVARNGNDLWGYTCSSQADALQDQAQSFVQFGKLCDMQQKTWFVTIIEAVIYLLSFITNILMVHRAAKQKKMGKIREGINMAASLEHKIESADSKFSFGQSGQNYQPLSG